MQDFRDCVEDIEMLDVQSTGLRYTWTQKPKGGHGILKKHDQIMANLDFNDVFMRAHAMFKPYRVSDHTPSLFLDVVKTEWDHCISGFFMFRLVKKLKNLKKPLRKLLYDKGNVHANVNKLRTDLDAIQTALDADPFNVALRERRSYIPQDMVREISNKEVKDAIFSIGDDKSPGPDGFTAAFFKEAWNIIANDVYLAVREFFRNEKEGKIEICECGGGLKCGWNGSETAHPKPQISCCNTEEFTYHSLVIIKEAWMNSSIFGLVPVFPKSIGFILQCSYSCQVSILQILPLEEGIRRLECFNSALMASHIWKLLTLKESLWVKWIHEYKLKGRNFWDFLMRGNMSWGWRKILKLRPIIRKFIWSKIGNGRNTYLWFDTWADFEPLAAQISPRDIVRLSFFSIRRDDARDTLVWRNIHGNVKKFLVSQVWDDIRHRESKVNWYSMVWFPSCIPRHAINLWLIIRRKLKTQDLVPMWDVSDSLGMGQICAGPVAHYTTRNVYVIIQALMPSYEEGTTNRRCVESLLLLAATYYVWKERFGEINSKKCMSTRSSSSNLFSSLPESLIRRRNLGEPSSLFDFEEVMRIPHNNMGPPPAGPPPPNNGPPPVVRPNGPAPRSMEKLCQPFINGRGRPISPIPIEATDFGLCHHMIQQVQNTCQFYGLPGDDANRHIDKFFKITQHMKQNGVFDDALRLSLFPYSLTHHAIACGRNFYAKDTGRMLQLIENMTAHHNHWDTSETRDETSRNISSTTTIENPEVARQLELMNKNFLEMMRQIQSVKSLSTRSGVAYDRPSIPPTPSPLLKEVERKTEATKDKVQSTSLESTTHVQPPVVQDPIPEPEVALKPKPKPSIPYHSKLNDQKLREKANNQMLKFLQIFQRLHFDISFADALLHMPKFASTFKSLLSNKEKLFELANTLLNENCSAVLLEKLPEKLGDPGKFLIPCDFLELDECLALADLDASINLMPLSVWKQLSLPELTSTRMTLELADRSLIMMSILGRPFLRTARALIDVYGKELTLQVDDEAIIFKVGQTSRYSRNYETINQVNVIDVACEQYAQEVLGFSDSSTSGNPTLSDSIIASSSPSFTPFEGGDFILEEIETFLRTPEELSNLDDDYYDTEGDILYLEKLLNEDPSPTLPPMKNDDLKQVVVTMKKPSIEEPPELELKNLPSHLEYAFLEGIDKLPVIISKELRDEE
ncbi:reverse transcriptase domain-containing protein [Tanacetum coccineum]